MMQIIHHLAAIDLSPLPQPADTGSGKIQSILTIVFAVTGSIALLIITLAGFRYIISQGNPQQTAQAKNAIIYAAVGLVVSIAAFSIVTFVVSSI